VIFKDSWKALLGATLITSLWWGDAAWRGGLGIARADDWSYLRTSFHFAETGALVLNGWVHMNFIGQALMSAPLFKIFDSNILSAQLIVGACGVALLWFSYSLSRFLLSPGLSFAVMFVVGINPIFGGLSPTFMTDVPSAAFQTAALYFAVKSLQKECRHRYVTFALSAVLAFAAFTIREYGILVLIPATVLFLIQFGRKRSTQISVAALFGLVLVSSVALYAWRRSLPNGVANQGMNLEMWLPIASGLILALGFLIIPFTLGFTGMNYWAYVVQRRKLLVVSGAASVAVAFLAQWTFIGNVIAPFGSTLTSVGDGVATFPLVIDRLIRIASILSVFVLISLFLIGLLKLRKKGNQGRFRQIPLTQEWATIWLLLLYVAVVSGTYLVASTFLGAPLYDRYMLPLLAPIGVLLLVFIKEHKFLSNRLFGSATIPVFAVYSAISIIFVDTAVLVDGARWSVAERASREAGIERRFIDGGDPWFRFYQDSVGIPGRMIEGQPWWVSFFPEGRVCQTVILTSRSDWLAAYGEPLLAETFSRPVGGDFTLAVYGSDSHCS
jgi:hypothetical protein